MGEVAGIKTEGTFRELCCQQLGIGRENFEVSVLRRCFPRHHKLVGQWLWRLYPGNFASDLELIRAVATCTSLMELRAELANHLYHHPNRGFWRRVVRARLSGQQLLDFAARFIH